MLFLSLYQHRSKIRSTFRSLVTSSKRVSFSFPLSEQAAEGPGKKKGRRYGKAGMTVEASLALPLFLFFMATLLYGFEIIRFQNDVWEALHKAGSELCCYTFDIGNDTEKEGEIAAKINACMEKQYLPLLCLDTQRGGLRTEVQRNVLAPGNTEITVSYSIKPFVAFLPISLPVFTDRFFGHDFVGYTAEGCMEASRPDETYVYITPSGTKYHLSQECSYLRVKIISAKGTEVETLRNTDGGKYYPCEQCHGKRAGMVYITEWGNRFHSDAVCSALKRTVYIIPKSQVGNRTECSRCGG